jgi:signal transduction histidine kinase
LTDRNMRRLLGIALFLLLCNKAEAQSFFEKNLDSAVALRLSQAELKEMMFRESFRALSTVEDDSLRLYAFVEYGKFLFFTSSFDSAYTYFMRAEKYAGNDLKSIASLQNMQGASLQRMEELEAAVTHYIHSATIYEELEDEVGQAKVYNNLSMVYQSTSDHDRAIEYIRKSIRINRSRGDSVKLGQNYNNLGIIFRTQIALDSARKYLELAVSIKSRFDNETSLQASSLNNLGLVLFKLKEYEQAEDYFLESIRIRQRIADRLGEISSIINLVELYITLQRFDEAQDYFDRISENEFNKDNLELRSRIEGLAGLLYRGLGDSEKSSIHFELAMKYTDTLNVSRTKNNMMELERQFRLDEKERKIRELELQQSADEKEQSRTQLFLLVLSGLVALLAGSMVVSYRRLIQNKKLSRKYLEEKKKAENTAVFKEQSLSILSHEVRTPLNGIVSLSQLLKTECRTQEQHEMVEMIEISASRLNKVIANVLDYSKYQAGKLDIELEEHDLVSTCKESVKSFELQAKIAGLEIRYFGEEELPLKFDPQLMHSVLNNLIGNAIKFTREGGKIGVQVKKSESKVYMSVIDSGIGMSPEQLENIFEPYEQVSVDKKSRSVGTGLGLSIVKQFSELMNATVYVESEKGKGSTFTVSFSI